MNMDVTPRLGMPLLAAGQAQKEVFHNEALALLDSATQLAVEATDVDAPPADPVAGQCWIVGDTPTGAWTGRQRAVACWTDGGWRFLPAAEGMTAWVGARAMTARFSGGQWSVGVLNGTVITTEGQQVVGPRQPAIAGPGGGATVDAEARAALSAILAALRAHGLIAT